MKSEEPEDYRLGWRPFLGCQVDLSQRPLIPREETEFWVDQAIKELKPESTAGKQVLDLFAGSGCIGLAVLEHCPGVAVTFGEREEKFCGQIRKNLKLNPPARFDFPPDLRAASQGLAGERTMASQGLAGRIRVESSGKVVQTDIFSKIKGQFDFIFANPPYVATRRSRVQASVRDWEPAGALFAGPDGLAVIRPFLVEAKKRLHPGGRIYLEFGYGQKGALEELLRQNGYKGWSFRRDQFGRWRWVVIQ